MKPESFYILFDVFDDIAANFRYDFLLWEIKSMELDFEGFNMFTESDDTSEISEEIGENFGFVEMSIPETFDLYVSDISHSCFFYIISELFKFGITAEEVSMSDM